MESIDGGGGGGVVGGWASTRRLGSVERYHGRELELQSYSNTNDDIPWEIHKKNASLHLGFSVKTDSTPCYSIMG